MRGHAQLATSGQSGHDHFFDTFVKFGPATWARPARCWPKLFHARPRGRVLYLELMLTPDGTTTGVVSSQIGDKVGWDGNFESTLNKLKTAASTERRRTGGRICVTRKAEKDRLLKCGTTQADFRLLGDNSVHRSSGPDAPLGQVFAQMVNGFAMANDPNSKVVALNLVQPEDALQSMKNFSLHMQCCSFSGRVSAGARNSACRRARPRSRASEG